MSIWFWRTVPARRLLVIVGPARPALVPRIERLFEGEPGTVDVVLDRSRSGGGGTGGGRGAVAGRATSRW